MKSKAKPVKGSARTKRFDSGGAVAALAGLGTLAYLLNKKKKGADGEYKPQGKFPEEQAQETAKPEPYKAVGNEGKDEIFKKNLQYSGGNPEDKPGGGGNVGTRIDTERPNSAARRTAAEVKSNVLNKRPEQVRVKTAPQSTETVQGVDEKKLDQLQRRNVGTGKKTAPTKKASSADDVIGAGIAAGNKQSKTTEAALNVIKTLKPGQRGVSGSGESKPYPEKEAAANKAAADKAAADKREKVLSQVRNQTHKVGTGQRTDSNSLAFGPRNTFLTRERLEESRKAMKGGWGKSLFERGDLGIGKKKGGEVKKYAKGGAIKASKMGSVKTAKPSMRSASSRADGIAQRGKTRA
jgi:hypothetical protein